MIDSTHGTHYILVEKYSEEHRAKQKTDEGLPGRKEPVKETKVKLETAKRWGRCSRSLKHLLRLNSNLYFSLLACHTVLINTSVVICPVVASP